MKDKSMRFYSTSGIVPYWEDGKKYHKKLAEYNFTCRTLKNKARKSNKGKIKENYIQRRLRSIE